MGASLQLGLLHYVWINTQSQDVIIFYVLHLSVCGHKAIHKTNISMHRIKLAWMYMGHGSTLAVQASIPNILFGKG